MLTIFYDGECGLCHRWVKFLIARDSAGDKFKFAPIGGGFYQKAFSAEVTASLPDSVIVLDEKNAIHTKAAGVSLALERIGGGWGVISSVLKILPRMISDWGYDCVAKIRKKLFAKPETACPFMDAATQKRFHLD